MSRRRRGKAPRRKFDPARKLRDNPALAAAAEKELRGFETDPVRAAARVCMYVSEVEVRQEPPR